MRQLKENLVVQFSVVSLVIMVVLTVVMSLVFHARLGRGAELLWDHGAAMMAGTMIKESDPFSIPSLNRDIHYLQWFSVALVGGAFSVLYVASVAIVWRGWRTIQRQQTSLGKAYEALRESEQRYRSLVDLSPEAVVVQSEGKYVYINDAGVRLYGAANAEELLGRPVMDFIHPDHRPLLAERIRQIQEEGKQLSPIEVKILRLDGQVIDVEGVEAPVTYQGKLAIQAIIRDVTERKRADKEIARLALAAGTIGEGICVTDTEGCIQYVNPALERMLQYEQGELIGRPVSDLHPGGPSDPTLQEIMKGLLSGKWSGEAGRRTKSGDLISTLETATAMYDETGQLVGYVCISADVTERNLLEEERAQNARDLQKALQEHQETQQQLIQSTKLAALGQLVSGVAHELNNPLTGIWGNSQMIMRKEIDENLREDLETIQDEASRAIKIVQNLLSFARDHKPEKMRASLNEAVEKAIDLRAYEMRVSGIKLERELQSDLPESWFDFHQMQQVFLNLIINAEQAMQEANGSGTLVIKTQRLRETVQISFADDGPGIPKEHMDRIFDPFFTTKEVGKGTGMGLSLCYGIIQEHGGSIQVLSKVGKGTTFIIELPDGVGMLAKESTGSEGSMPESSMKEVSR